jgi:hypothetical protein
VKPLALLVLIACDRGEPSFTLQIVPGPPGPDTETGSTEPPEETEHSEDTEPTVETGPEDTGGSVVPPWSGPIVVLNEVMSNNDSVVSEPGLPAGDWFELYNPGPDAVDLARVVVEADGEAWRGVGVLPAGAHRLVWASGAAEDASHATFRLASSGETVVVYVDGVEVDRVDVPELAVDLGWGRFPDGGSPGLTIWPTAGFTNGSTPGDSTDPTEVVFQTDIVWDVDVTLSEEAIRALDASPYNDVHGSVAFLGAFWPDVAIRKKGVYGSLRSMDQKVALRIDFDDYAPGSLRGMEVIALNNMVQDASAVHELLTYELFRAAGLPAPRVGYVRMHLNGELYGLYAVVESPTVDFLERWYADPTGPMFEGAYGVDFYVGSEFSFEYDEGPDPNDRSTLTELARALDRSPAVLANYTALRSLFDMDQFQKVMAIEALTIHWDGYTTANNYRVYHDPTTSLFTMIPWGADQTWANDWYDAYSGYGRLLQWCVASEACRADYNTQQVAMADLLEALPHEARMDEVLALIQPEIAVDPKREYDLRTHTSTVAATRARILAAPDDIRSSLR